MVKINQKKFKDAILDSGGIITTIANRIGVTRKAIYDWLVKNPEMKDYLEQETEKILDMAEISLFSQVKDKDLGATKYILSTKGKKRGYIERQELEHSGNIGVTKINIVMPDGSDIQPNKEASSSIQKAN